MGWVRNLESIIFDLQVLIAALSKLTDKDLFWNGIWDLMRQTYNLKYPEKKVSKEDLKSIRYKIGKFAVEHSQKLSLDQFHHAFGGEDGIDLFYFGVYTTDIKVLPPWQEEENDKGADSDDTEEKNKFDVDPTYGSLIEHEQRKREKEEQEEKEKEKEVQRFWLSMISFIVIALGVSLFFCKS